MGSESFKIYRKRYCGKKAKAGHNRILVESSAKKIDYVKDNSIYANNIDE